MNAGAYFGIVAQLPFGTLRDLTAMEPFIVVAPHPDDETLGCAGLMAGATACSVPCGIVVVTDGVASHPRSKTHPADRLRRVRRDESLAAAALSGVSADRVIFLDLPDSRLPEDAGLYARAAEGVAAAAERIGAKSVFVTWRHDPHCDHVVVHDVTRDVAARLGLRLWSYPIWGWTLPSEASLCLAAPQGCRLDVGEWLDVKRRAIACHASQTTRLIADDPDGFILTAEMLKRFDKPVEYFLRGPA